LVAGPKKVRALVEMVVDVERVNGESSSSNVFFLLREMLGETINDVDGVRACRVVGDVDRDACEIT